MHHVMSAERERIFADGRFDRGCREQGRADGDADSLRDKPYHERGAYVGKLQRGGA